MKFWCFSTTGFVLDKANNLCYQIIADLNDFEDGKSACEGLDAEMVQFESDAQATSFIGLLKAG